MRLKNFFRFGGISDDRGHSIVEFALVAPLMILMALGATDFSRVFHDAETVVSAANSGSVYGVRRIIDSVDDSEIQARALSDTFGTEADQSAVRIVSNRTKSFTTKAGLSNPKL